MQKESIERVTKREKRDEGGKTAAIPALQTPNFYIPLLKKQEAVSFDKTTVVNTLAQEPIAKEKTEAYPAIQEKQQTLILRESDLPKARTRKDRLEEKTSSVFWVVLAIGILVFTLLIILSSI